jgi:hypothetical protein
MNALPQVLLFAVLPGPAAVVAGLTALPELSFVLEATSIGTVIGALVALRAKRRFARVDTWAVTTAWSGLGLLVGVVITIFAAVV